jgi:hypothetical protein
MSRTSGATLDLAERQFSCRSVTTDFERLVA